MNEEDTPPAPVADPVIDPALQEDVTQLQPATAKPAKKAVAKQKPASSSKTTNKRKGKAKSAATVQDSDGEGQAEVQSEEVPQRRKPAAKKTGRKRKNKKDGVAAAETTGRDDEQPRDEDAQADEEEEDESDPELHEIDPNTVTMQELARAKKHGKTSEMEKKMAEINWEEVVAKRREAEQKAMEQAAVEQQQRMQAQLGDQPVRQSTEGRDGTAEQPAQQGEQQEQPQEQDEPTQPVDDGGVQFKLVNGQIVADEISLTLPNQAQAQAEADAAMTEAVEENDLTAKINNATYMNSRKRDLVERSKPVRNNKGDPWNEEETERFYDALKMFGSDFLIISKMFAGKTRAQVKNKFLREERLDLVRINNALLGRDTNPTPMNLEHYARETGRDVADYTKWSTHEEAMASIKEDMHEKEQEARQAIAQEAEDQRQRDIAEKERVAARKRKGGKKGGAAKGKKKGGAGLGGGGPAEGGGVGVEG